MNSREYQSDEKKKRDAFVSFAGALIETEEADKKAKKQILIDGIEKREKQNKKSLSTSKLLTETLSKIRVEAGLSAFVGTSGKIKSPKFRRKEFIKLLAREILLIGREELHDLGGVLSLTKIQSHFKKTRENWELKDNDIKEAISVLLKNDIIPSIEQVSDKETLVYFIPAELSSDGKKILEVSTGIEVTFKRLTSILNWQEERVKSAVNQLIQDGLAVVDEDNIYFPGLN